MRSFAKLVCPLNWRLTRLRVKSKSSNSPLMKLSKQLKYKFLSALPTSTFLPSPFSETVLKWKVTIFTLSSIKDAISSLPKRSTGSFRFSDPIYSIDLLGIVKCLFGFPNTAISHKLLLQSSNSSSSMPFSLCVRNRAALTYAIEIILFLYLANK